ncbi:MAG TPA: hypothetical protein VMU54_08970 [Planctomycetota bacterium]|nr:hypothetical protein [Planctomycetota bacterium]
MDLKRAYRRWRWKRLAFLLPSVGAGIGVNLWLGLFLACPPSLRILGLSLAAIVTALLGYLTLLTFACSGSSRKTALQHARALRQHLNCWRPLCAFSLLCLIALVSLPAFFLPTSSSHPALPSAVVLHRISAPAPLAVPAPEQPSNLPGPVADAPPAVLPESAPRVRSEVPDPKLAGSVPKELVAPAGPLVPAPASTPEPAPTPETPTALVKSPAPVPPPVWVSPPAPVAMPDPAVPPVPAVLPFQVPPQKPDLRPELPGEPSHLVLDDREPFRSDRIDVPRSFRSDEPGSRDNDPYEGGLSAFRVDRELFAQWPLSGGFFLGLSARPLPDENDSESWLFPEGRVDGFVLMGNSGGHVPGIMLTLDIPVGRDDSILLSWTGALLPEPPGVEASLRPNWNHVTLAYTRRLAGYTRQATFDLSVSVGACADFFRAAEGIADPGMDPKFAPYVGIDLAFWQHEPVGFIVHVGEALPIAVVGSSLGMTDMSAEIRWDLSQRVSIHGGYRILLLKYKYDDVSRSPGAVALNDSLSGPILGVDIRF